MATLAGGRGVMKEVAEVGVRELRDHLSQYLERVQRGEEVIVTDRGRAVARLGPTVRTRLEELIEAGVVTPARKPKSDSLPQPVEFEGDVAELVAEQRR